MEQRQHFGSRMGAILAAAGSAVGLGNIWRFPCETGQNGGAAFILIYIICIALVTVPVLITELATGREARSNAYDTYKRLALEGRGGRIGRAVWLTAGFMCLIGGFLVFAYYSVVAGWTLKYAWAAATDTLLGRTAAGFTADFASFTADPLKPFLCLVAFVIMTTAIVILGVRKGIERGSKIMMPLLLLLLVVLAVCSLSLPGSMEGVRFLFQPDFSKITTHVWLEALGQAFFTLSVGIGTLMTYASYFSPKVNIVKDAYHVAVIDTLVAILAGVIIFPAAMSVGVSPDAGPALVFITLPNVFQQAFGATPLLCYIVTVAFYILLVMAALTSSISMLEITTAFISEKTRLSRTMSAIVLAVLTCAAGFCCSMSFGDWSSVTVFGMGFFDLCDFIVAKFAMPLGSIFLCLLLRRMGRERVTRMLTNDGHLHLGRFPHIFYLLTTTLVPVAILIIFINGII